MADPNPILVDKAAGVATITFNRPHVRNAIDQDKIWMLQEALARLEQDQEVRAIVLTGAGDNFLAGGDIKFFERSLDWTRAERRAQFEAVVNRINPVMLTLRRMPQPVIASVRGAVAGWGISLVMASDLAIAADDAKFTFAYSLLGACPEGSGSYFLPRTIGMKKAMELALLSERLDANGALVLGIVNKVVPTADLGEATRELATRLAAGPTHAYGVTKRLLNRTFSNTLETQLQAEAEGFADCAATGDFEEGVRAFLERRKPVFSGL
jgi:2-(1,2-epoxy-1,2-dihydrophenyl)acetyl-CoA isomerase